MFMKSVEPGLEIDTISEISGERRSRRRYAIGLPLRYQAMEDRRHTGMGTTINISSSGLVFESRDYLPVGSYIDVLISWPVRSPDKRPLQVAVQGRVVRNDAVTTAVQIVRHEFRQEDTTSLWSDFSALVIGGNQTYPDDGHERAAPGTGVV